MLGRPCVGYQNRRPTEFGAIGDLTFVNPRFEARAVAAQTTKIATKKNECEVSTDCHIPSS